MKDFGIPQQDFSNYNLVYDHDGRTANLETIWKMLRYPPNAKFSLLKSSANSGPSGLWLLFLLLVYLSLMLSRS